MVVIEFNRESISQIFDFIHDSIYQLKGHEISPERIKISMPTIIKKLLEYHSKEFYSPNDVFKINDILYSTSIVPGYNNQICVFDDMAMPNGYFIEPLKIEFNVKQKENSDTL